MAEDEFLSYGRQAVNAPASQIAGASDFVTRAGDAATKSGAKAVRDPRGTDEDPIIEELCITPGELAFLLPKSLRNGYRPVLGTFAERLIEEDYCVQHNCQRFNNPGTRQYDYFDDTRAPQVMIAFYRRFNEHLTDNDAVEMLNFSKRKKLFKFPDIMRHTENVTQFFEIKPDNKGGKSDGREKLALLDAFNDFFQLPYRRGVFYNPTEEMRIAIFSVEGVPLELFLSVRRPEKGLILYKFCVSGEITKASKRLGKRVRKLALLGLLLGLIIPIEDPVERPIRDPVESPEDQPIPMPVPAAAEMNSVVPVPYLGSTNSDFTFYYVRGLSRRHKKGQSYPITIKYDSQGEELRTVIEFYLKKVSEGVSYLVSNNKVSLNIAPTGHNPLVIRPGTVMNVTWHH